MKDYNETILYLYSLQKYGIKLGLENTIILLSKLGNPHLAFHSIHIAGTNGKGSTSTMAAAILMEYGYKVGLFTSPHIVSFTERIKINNNDISKQDIISLSNEIRLIIQKYNLQTPTFFEFTTVMAFVYFFRQSIEWAVIEVGMGGRLDSTNVLIPDISVITPIDFDHQQFLGSSLAEIGYEKAGIIKPHSPVVSASQHKEVRDVIRKTADAKNASIFEYNKDFKSVLKTSGLEGISFDYFDKDMAIKDLKIYFKGLYQMSNASLAIKATFEVLKKNEGFKPDKIAEGLEKARLQGRLEFIQTNPPMLLDGAHNPVAAQKLADFVKTYLSDYRIILILGIMSDKDINGVLNCLLPIANEIIFTSIMYERAESPQILKDKASLLGYSSRIAFSLKEALQEAKDICKFITMEKSLILLTGSFYLLGEIKELLGERGILKDLRETL